MCAATLAYSARCRALKGARHRTVVDCGRASKTRSESAHRRSRPLSVPRIARQDSCARSLELARSRAPDWSRSNRQLRARCPLYQVQNPRSPFGDDRQAGSETAWSPPSARPSTPATRPCRADAEASDTALESARHCNPARSATTADRHRRVPAWSPHRSAHRARRCVRAAVRCDVAPLTRPNPELDWSPQNPRPKFQPHTAAAKAACPASATDAARNGQPSWRKGGIAMRARQARHARRASHESTLCSRLRRCAAASGEHDDAPRVKHSVRWVATLRRR